MPVFAARCKELLPKDAIGDFPAAICADLPENVWGFSREWQRNAAALLHEGSLLPVNLREKPRRRLLGADSRHGNRLRRRLCFFRSLTRSSFCTNGLCES